MRLTPQVIADLYPSLSERLQGDLGRDAAFDLYLCTQRTSALNWSSLTGASPVRSWRWDESLIAAASCPPSGAVIARLSDLAGKAMARRGAARPAQSMSSSGSMSRGLGARFL